MADKDTVIVVGVTRKDEYNNLWITPQGGGDEVKIAAKREQLHGLFQQGKAVMLHWETYRDKPYVSDAKLVEGELPPAQPSDRVLPQHQKEIEKAKPEPILYPRPKPEIAPQERGMWWKEVGENFRKGLFNKNDKGEGALLWRAYITQMITSLEIKFDKPETK